MQLRACSRPMPPFPPLLPFPQRPVTPGTRLRRRAVTGLLCALCGGLGMAGPVAQAGRDDGQLARTAREQGRIVPLEQLVAEVGQKIPGRLLQAELDDDDGLPVYELRWQLADGRRLEIELDARDGRWLKIKGPRLETVFKAAPAGIAAGAPRREAGR